MVSFLRWLFIFDGNLIAEVLFPSASSRVTLCSGHYKHSTCLGNAFHALTRHPPLQPLEHSVKTSHIEAPTHLPLLTRHVDDLWIPRRGAVFPLRVGGRGGRHDGYERDGRVGWEVEVWEGWEVGWC
jgi:hypothetical protein